MLAYTMDVEERSRWIIAMPPATATVPGHPGAGARAGVSRVKALVDATEGVVVRGMPGDGEADHCL